MKILYSDSLEQFQGDLFEPSGDDPIHEWIWDMGDTEILYLRPMELVN